MIVMGLDTTGATCSVSIVNDAQVLAHICEDLKRGHAERLAPMVAEAMEAAQLIPDQIDRLAVCTGPGGFTGLRVALSFAIGFAMPRGTPVVGIDALDVTANEILHTKQDKLIGVMRDVRRGEVFYAQYSQGFPLSAPRAMPRAQAELSADQLQAAIYDAHMVDTRTLAWLAMDRDPATHPAEPLYARGPDAKLPGGKSLPKRS